MKHYKHDPMMNGRNGMAQEIRNMGDLIKYPG